MEAAFLAYGDEALARSRFDAAGLTAAGCEVRFFHADSTACFVVHHLHWLLLAFRGTEIENAWGAVMDAATALTVLPIRHHSGGRLHKGFYDALNAVWQPVMNYIQQRAKASTPKYRAAESARRRRHLRHRHGPLPLAGAVCAHHQRCGLNGIERRGHATGTGSRQAYFGAPNFSGSYRRDAHAERSGRDHAARNRTGRAVPWTWLLLDNRA
jgi:hypothetical protein